MNEEPGFDDHGPTSLPEPPPPPPEPEPPKPVEVFADYVDGMTAGVERVSIWSKPDAILLRFASGDELTWALDDLRALCLLYTSDAADE